MQVYIDCGCYKGTIIEEFLYSLNKNNEYKIYAFESNPFLRDFNYGEGINVIHKACWVYDGEVDFYIDTTNPISQGCSICKEKDTGYLDKEHPMSVPCIDFSKWLLDTFSQEDTLIVKMNIEGAEYDVIEKCIKDGSINLIKELFIEWHYDRVGISEDRHDAIIQSLKQIPNLVLNTITDTVVFKKRLRYVGNVKKDLCEHNDKLFIAPHPDDEALFGTYLIMSYKPLVAIYHSINYREEESTEAMKYLGVDVVFINNLNELPNDFNTVFAPALEHGHSYHDKVHFEAKEKYKNIIYYSTYRSMTDVTPWGPVRVRADEEMKLKKIEVLNFYKSQFRLKHFLIKNKDEYIDREI